MYHCLKYECRRDVNNKKKIKLLYYVCKSFKSYFNCILLLLLYEYIICI